MQRMPLQLLPLLLSLPIVSCQDCSSCLPFDVQELLREMGYTRVVVLEG